MPHGSKIPPIGTDQILFDVVPFLSFDILTNRLRIKMCRSIVGNDQLYLFISCISTESMA